jgi:O-antigen/teichoic acid export membrane protein
MAQTCGISPSHGLDPLVRRFEVGYNPPNSDAGGWLLRSRRWLLDLGALLVLLILPLILFWPVAVGSKTLIPADNLYQWEPYRTFADDQGVDLPPHNELLSDLVLENLVWKQFIVESIQAREIPLWNPHLFAGVPFLAAGQHSALYPLSALFYTLPLTRAYGLFTVLQLWMAGVYMYLFVRVLRLGVLPALVASITYQLSAFFLVSVVFTMIIAAAAWLPLLLAIIEVMIRKQEEKEGGPFVPIIYVVPGAVALGVHILAGHPEILVYTLMVMAYYALARLALLWWRLRSWTPVVRLGAWLGFMVGLGLGLGSVQLIPLFELVTRSFRQGSVTYSDVVGWAYPTRQVFTFLVPDFFGNPAHHGFWDIVSREWVAVDRIFWGIKNYVEAGSYVGILPLILAVVAVLPAVKRSASASRMREGPSAMLRPHVWIFAILAVASLLFVFGTPLYALLYYGLPGIKQLHSPFRWVFPYTLSIAVLAGIGLQRLADLQTDPGEEPGEGIPRPTARNPWIGFLTWSVLVGGVILVLGLIGVLLVPGPFIPLADQFLSAVEEARPAFGSGQMLLSYQWRNFLIFGLMLAGSGLVLHLGHRPMRGPRWLSGSAGGRGARLPLVGFLAVILVAVDLLVFGAGFNPAADPDLLGFRPPAIQFLQERATESGPWRVTTYQVPGDSKTLNANIPWLHHLEDVRGYDSIIPRQYVEYVSLIESQGELLHNRVAPVYGIDNLSSPLLDLLNVRYVVTEGEIPNPDYALVFDGEARVYENMDTLPRAFSLPRAERVSEADLPVRLHTLDPRQVVLLDQDTVSEAEVSGPDAPWPFQTASVVTHASNTVFVDVEMPGAGWLVLTDSYFPGWKAYRSDLGESALADQPPDPKAEPADETELEIVRANGNFRAVHLGPGTHRVRFKYTPLSFKLGLFGSFMAFVVLCLLLLYWMWGRYYRESVDDPTVKRVAKNSLLPMGLQLLNKIIDFAFAMLMLRILAPEMAGRYTFAVAFIGYFDILIRFGLGTLLTREVAREQEQGNRYLSTVTILRGLLWLTSVPLMTVAVFVYVLAGEMTHDIVTAIAFFAIALMFSSLADGFSAVFYAYEKMEYPAAISTITALTRASLGVLVLLMGWGFVGLAAVSVVANIVSATTMGILMVRHCFRPHLEWDPQTGKWMMRTSFPLMINLLLATVFFRIDVLLLKPMKGDAVVGYYGAAYKYIDGLNIIPAYFTQAIFPMMSRFAASARDSLMRAYVLSLRLLLIVALPIAAGTPFIARGLILVLGGGEYLPDSEIALQLIIWFLPFSFINSVTQYVLIAIDQQSFLTKAFLIGVVFNIVANLLVIPAYSYKGAAVVTVLSEIVLLIPFYYSVRKHLGQLPWVSLFWKPAVASLFMAGVMWLVADLPWLLLVPVGATVYLVVLALVGGFRQPDMDLLRALVPSERFRSRLSRSE